MDTPFLTFLFSKFIGFALNPYSLFIGGVLVGFMLLMTRRWQSRGRLLLGVVILCYVVFAMFPVGTWAVNLLEDRFATVREPDRPPVGILVLGGSVSTVMTRERGQVSVGGSVERLSEFVRLARRYPRAKLAYVGGQGLVFDRKPSEAEVTARFLRELGMDTSNVWFEDRSRNTEEGARISFQKLQPGRAEWLLITSARHMPRAMGLFRKAGWNVIAQPTDYLTLPGGRLSWSPGWPGSLGPLNDAVYEWAGLMFAWMRGKIDQPFPGPFPDPVPVAQVKPSDS